MTDRTREDEAATSASSETKLDVPSRKSNPVIAVDPDFGPRYRVLGEIGKGGMGEVFRAYDTELREEVALKVVRGDQDDDASLARFRREIALARKVTDANVLRVYDLAEHAGQRFLSMQLVEGEHLGALLKREGRLPLDRALTLFRQVCRGVAAAHAQGVVHRDIKPQNILVDRDSHVFVADFGLARSIGESGLTVAGAILGSPAYMSPEQVTGASVDERSDIYSLGILLYQLLTGETPFRADTPHAVMEMRMHQKPRPVREVVPDVPAYLETVVTRALALDPATRYQTVKGLLDDVDGKQATATTATSSKRTAMIGIAAIAVLGGGVLMWKLASRPDAATVNTGSGSAAGPNAAAPLSGLMPTLIIGIENQTNDPLFDQTLDMVLESALRRSTRLDPTAGFSLKNLVAQLTPDNPKVDDQTGAVLSKRDGREVITIRGVVSGRGSAFRIAVTAKRASTGAVLLAKERDAASLADVVPTMGQLALDLRAAAGEDVNAEKPETGQSLLLEADHEYTVGLGMCRSGNTDGCMEHLKLAVKLDPEYVGARVLLGRTYANMSRRADAGEHFDVVMRFVDRMGERDRLKFLGDYYLLVTNEYKRAVASYEALLMKWPGDLGASTNLGIAYASYDPKKALEAGMRAAQEHKFELFPRANVANYLISAGQFADALREAKQVTVDFAHPLPELFEYAAVAAYALHQPEEVKTAIEKLRTVSSSYAGVIESDIAIAEGRYDDAAKLLVASIAADQKAGASDPAELKHVMLAELELRRGQKRAALAAAARVTTEPVRRFAAGLVQLAAGDEKAALATSAALAKEVTPEARTWSKLLVAEAQRLRGNPEDAMVLAEEALQISDRWFGHYLIARAALDAKKYPQAYSELSTVLESRGRVVWVEYRPSLRHEPPVHYYLARAREALGSPDAVATYRAFLAMTPNPDGDDTLVLDAKQRLARLAPSP